MRWSVRTLVALSAVAAASGAGMPKASAQDFFSLFDNAFGGKQQSQGRSSFAPDNPFEQAPARRPAANYSSGSGTYCVRTCDGRHFPVPAAVGQSKAEACNSFCPASETKVFYGSSIDNAASDNGKRYSDLPNAFRYRNELVSGCTCNGKDPVGLAQVKIEDDKTVRRGDLIGSANGLMTATRGAEGRRTSLQLAPAAASVQARFSRLPVVAAQ